MTSMTQRDFGVLPVPSWLRHEEGRTLHFGLVLNIAFGAFATFTVSSLYYIQPILVNVAAAFGVSANEISNVPTLVQAGYAGGLLFITPLGDLVQRRQLILLLILLAGSLTIGLAVTNSVVVFQALSFLVGVFSVVPQILVPFAADLAPPERKAGAISVVWAALMLGVLFGRVLSGIIVNFTSYRNVYYMAVGLLFATLGAAYLVVPNVPAKPSGLNYFGILKTMGKLAVTQPRLIQCALGVLTSSASFTNLWVTLDFLLSDAPYHYSSLDIGLFGLLGMLGIVLGPFLGRQMDSVYPWWGALISAMWLLVLQAGMVAGAGINLAPVILLILIGDLFRQTWVVALTSMAFAIDPAARGRINAVMTVSMFVGQVIGTISGTAVFLKYGWRACYGLGLGFTGLQLLILLARGPHIPDTYWFGWAGGWRFRKPTPAPGPVKGIAALPDSEAAGQVPSAGAVGTVSEKAEV